MLTVRPGHRTEEHEHVLNKIYSNNNFKGAQKVKTLCLSSMVLAFMAAPSFAQSPVYSTNNSPSAQAAAQVEIRLQQMETQIRELTGRVEQQVYEINQLKQEIKTLENMQAAPLDTAPLRGSGQIAMPERDPMAPVQSNPLNLDIKPPTILGMKTSVPGGGTTDATALYEQAFAYVKSQNYEQAQEGFETFLKDHPDHVLAANAKYWLGETHYVRGEYKKSARIFAEGFQNYPESAKAPDILLKLGMSLAGMNKEKEACVALSQVAIKFPAGNDPVLGRADQEMEKLGCQS